MKLERKENGETVTKSVAQKNAAKMLAKGWAVPETKPVQKFKKAKKVKE
tara:strand:+ start:9594 stop:9740 length:147 start_codon:yes stop_codon:yes gene_type:complete